MSSAYKGAQFCPLGYCVINFYPIFLFQIRPVRGVSILLTVTPSVPTKMKAVKDRLCGPRLCDST